MHLRETDTFTNQGGGKTPPSNCGSDLDTSRGGDMGGMGNLSTAGHHPHGRAAGDAVVRGGGGGA